MARLDAAGIEVIMLTGDNAETARSVAASVGITDFRAGVMPQDKADAVRAFKTGGRVTGMVGDGVNDAPALAAADVSFAIGAGSAIAIEAADVTLIRNDLNALVDAILLSRATLRKIRQNLFFAFAYNLLGIPLAALGLLNPVIAGAAMAASSVSVVGNALLLKRWRPRSMKEKMMETVTLKVDGMTCGGCVASVERVLKAVPGVVAVKVQLSPGLAEVNFDPARTGSAALQGSRRGGGL